MKGKIVKSLIALCLVASMVMSSFAAVVSADDSSSFVTKAEFEAIKSNYDNQIKGYLSSVDEKIDNTIANYLNNFAGGAGGTLKMSEKTAVYKHSLKITKFKNTAWSTDTTAPVIELYSTKKTPFVIDDFVFDDDAANDAAFLCQTKEIGKKGIALEPNQTLLYEDDFNIDYTGIPGTPTMLNGYIGSFPVQHPTYATAKYLTFRVQIREGVTHNGKELLHWYFDLRTESNGYISGTGNFNWKGIEFTDTVSLFKENPVDMGAQYAASGEMISKAQMNMGLNQATYKHVVKLTRIIDPNNDITNPPNFTFYSTYPKPLTIEDIRASYKYSSEVRFVLWQSCLSQYGLMFPSVQKYGTSLKYGRAFWCGDASTTTLWAEDKSSEDKKTKWTYGGKTYEADWLAMYDSDTTEGPFIAGKYTVDSTQKYFNFNQVYAITDTVTVASTNPLTYGSKHLVTGDVFNPVALSVTKGTGYNSGDIKAYKTGKLAIVSVNITMSTNVTDGTVLGTIKGYNVSTDHVYKTLRDGQISIKNSGSDIIITASGTLASASWHRVDCPIILQ